MHLHQSITNMQDILHRRGITMSQYRIRYVMIKSLIVSRKCSIVEIKLTEMKQEEKESMTRKMNITLSVHGWEEEKNQSRKECPSILPSRPVSQSISQRFPLGAAVPSKSLSRSIFLWYLPPADQRGERSAGKKFIIHTTQKITSGLLFLIPWYSCALFL
jgi:hypothetical protein